MGVVESEVFAGEIPNGFTASGMCKSGNRRVYMRLSVGYIMARAKTVPHAEYEILKLISDCIELQALRERMVPEGDDVAAKRFDTGAKNVANLVNNLATRRQHRLPKTHQDFQEKGQ